MYSELVVLLMVLGITLLVLFWARKEFNKDRRDERLWTPFKEIGHESRKTGHESRKKTQRKRRQQVRKRARRGKR